MQTLSHSICRSLCKYLHLDLGGLLGGALVCIFSVVQMGLFGLYFWRPGFGGVAVVVQYYEWQ